MRLRLRVLKMHEKNRKERKMTPIEIEKALAEIVLEKERIVDEKLRVLDKGAKTEKKALMIEKGMYSLCLHAGLLYNAMGETERAKCKIGRAHV